MLIKLDSSHLELIKRKLNYINREVNSIERDIASKERNTPIFIKNEYGIGYKEYLLVNDSKRLSRRLEELCSLYGRFITDANEIIFVNGHTYSSGRVSDEKWYHRIWNRAAEWVGSKGVKIKKGVAALGDHIKNAWVGVKYYGVEIYDFWVKDWQESREELNRLGFIGSAITAIPDAIFYWSDWDEHKDEMALIGAVSIHAGKAVWKLLKLDFIGATDEVGKSAYTLQAIFVEGEEREKLLKKDGSDLVDELAKGSGFAFDTAEVFQKGFKFITKGAFSATIDEDFFVDILGDLAGVAKGGDSNDLIVDLAFTDYPIVNEVYDFADDFKEYYDGIPDHLK